MLGLLIAAAGYFAQALLLAPLAGWFESDRAAVLDAYAQFVKLASEGWIANDALVAWTCAALSLYVAGWFTRRTLA